MSENGVRLVLAIDHGVLILKPTADLHQNIQICQDYQHLSMWMASVDGYI